MGPARGAIARPRLTRPFKPFERPAAARDNRRMPQRRNVLTPEALAMIDAIARTGSFAAAAREAGKVPSALTYAVRQLEDALDVLLFDRSSRQARLTAAGQELLVEGRRLLQEMDAVANRVRRVASGWETELAISVEDIVSQTTVFELVEAFCGVCGVDGHQHGSGGGAHHLAVACHHVAGARDGTGHPIQQRPMPGERADVTRDGQERASQDEAERGVARCGHADPYHEAQNPARSK